MRAICLKESTSSQKSEPKIRAQKNELFRRANQRGSALGDLNHVRLSGRLRAIDLGGISI